MKAHALGGVGELPRNFLCQQVMTPAAAVASDEASRTIEGVGLGRVIADPDRYVWMEGARREGAGRQKRVAHGRFKIVGIK
jgi:hypothetical protein